MVRRSDPARLAARGMGNPAKRLTGRVLLSQTFANPTEIGIVSPDLIHIAALAAVGVCGFALADEIRVPDDCDTIQEAIFAGKDGDVVIVADGGDTMALPTGVTTDPDGNPRFVGNALTPDSGSPPDSPASGGIADTGCYEFPLACRTGHNADDVAGFFARP